METVTVKSDITYNIYIECGLIKEVEKLISDITVSKNVFIVSDSNVFPIYGNKLSKLLSSNGYSVSSYIFEAGEKSKTFKTVENMLLAFCKSEITREDTIIALGGGVCGDLAGFASAIYLRGIKFVQIPTSLLAMIDSSVGGKTGCDLPSGKNLAGAFHNPSAVIIDPDLLDTLPEAYFFDGIGEAIKYGVIKSSSLFKRLETENAKSFVTELISECVKIKRDVVKVDFTEKGERILLNFGHTIGHAIEKKEKFCGISHGAAVGIGMVMITKSAEAAHLCEKGTADRIASLLSKYSLPVSTDIISKELVDLSLSDKKRRSNYINIVLCNKIGKSFVKKINIADLEGFIEEGKI